MREGRGALWALVCVGAAWCLSGCNLGFDASQYGPVEVEEDAGDLGGDLGGDADQGPDQEEPLPCVDNDRDNFGQGEGCPEDQRDCDDRRPETHPGAEEICDGRDNDCDGETDEGPDGGPLTMRCYTGQSADLEVDSGACQEGVVACVSGAFPSPPRPDQCEGQVLPTALGEREGVARCDGIDNDCDGVVDPECPCEFEGETRRCYEAGPPGARGVGICVEGVQECVSDGGDGRQWGPCEGDVAPVEEACDNMGRDDDCDGQDDNIATLSGACETGEPGRCSVGTWRCVSGALSCVRNLNPVAEVCDEIDSDCDGTLNNGVSNVCGGCGVLAGAPGESCGECGDGEFVCQQGALVCQGARARNACGGCGGLPEVIGGACGECGAWACDGQERATCADPGANACGGCGAISGGDLLGTRCGVCGTYQCDGEASVRCQERPLNSCNGCAELEGQPGSSCGVCGDGRYACDGVNAVSCVGASPLNACGGCQSLQGQAPGGACGACGRLECDPENPGALRCADPGRNACGGCSALANPPGNGCGLCGEYACAQGMNSTFCNDPGNNACGGCASLAGAPGAACGVCGEYACDGAEAVTCEDAGLNACNGCGALEGAPGAACGVCGQWRCSVDNARVLCQDPGANACGGCGAITGGDTLGDPCGVCGEVVCDGGNRVRCEDPGVNSCLGCGELSAAPGGLCNGGCGFYVCSTQDVTCDTRRCPSAPTVLRVFHLVRGGPEFDGRVDGTIPVTGFEYGDRTVYVRLPPGDHYVEFFTAGTGFTDLRFRYDFSLADGEQSTAVFYGAADGDYGAEDFFKIEDENVPVEGLVKIRYTNLVLSDAPPPNGVGPQLPVGPVDVRFLNAQLNVVHVIEDVPYGETSVYSQLPPGEYFVQVALDGNPLAFGNFNTPIAFKGGEVISLMHHGASNGEQSLTHHPSTLDERFFP